MDTPSYNTAVSLRATYAVYQLLTSCKALAGISVFPVVSEDNVKFPCICVSRTGLSEVSVKSRDRDITSTIAVTIYANDYLQGVNIAEEVLKNLKPNTAYTIPDVGRVREITLINGAEDWDGVYIQTLAYNLKIT